jgi:hypothetical protein
MGEKPPSASPERLSHPSPKGALAAATLVRAASRVAELHPSNTVCQLGLTSRRPKMNSDQIKGNWKQFVGKAKEKWG